MSTIIPLSKASCNTLSLDMREDVVAHRNEDGYSKLEKDIRLDAIDEFVDFILSKGDEDEISNFKQSLSDFSRYKGHMYDTQLERIDKWKCMDKLRYEELYDAIKGILKEPNISIHGDYFNIQNNKIEK